VVDTRQQYDGLLSLYLPIAIGVCVLVFVLVVAFALRYRRREDGRRPSRIADAPRVEGVYALFLACVVVLLLVFTYTTEGKVDRVSAHPALAVKVTAAKWHWRFDYPAYGITELGRDVTGTSGGEPGAVPTLYVPAGETVEFTITALDVIHAFWIPDLRFKRDANPGRTDRFDMAFPRPESLLSGGECSEFCGLNHAGMRFNVQVLAPAAFRAWAQAHRGRS